MQHENSPKDTGFQELPYQIWELPTQSATGVDMKEHLKLWARSVASLLKC